MKNLELTESALKLKSLRKKKGITVQELADKYGIPKRTVVNWEIGGREHRECPTYTLNMLERLLNIDYPDLE